MNTMSVFTMDKDSGYAWVILGASTILMCVGPSTFSAYGFLLRDVPVTLANKAWVLNVFYVCWLLSAFFASCFVRKRPRQLATSGAAVAAIGFLTSASMIQDISWIYLTFSLFVGIGLGLSFHTAYLVVMSNFDHYKGLANGVCQLCIAIGQITTPFLFTIVSMPRDRFQIKALTTAIGFLTTLFFVVPKNPPQQRRQTIVGDRNRRPSTVSRRSSLGEAVPLHSGFIPVPSNSIPIQNSAQAARPRRRSQYLLAVSTSLLPNIPEEPESTTHSTNDTLTSASSDSEITNVQPPSSLGSQSVSVITPSSANGWNELSPTPLNSLRNGEKAANPRESSNDSVGSPSNGNQHVPLRRLSEGCLPTYIGDDVSSSSNNASNSTSPSLLKSLNASNEPTRRTAGPRVRRHSESLLQQSSNQSTSVNPSGGSFNSDFTAIDIKGQGTSPGAKKPQQEPAQPPARKISAVARPRKGESIVDLSLLKDYQFLNMASFSALCTMTVVNYPIVLYIYIINTCEGCTKDADIALIIIYIVDLVSRLLFSYLADVAAFSKRRSFHVACACAGVLIAATTVVKDVTLIYCFCVVYGTCLGLIVTSEYLMFIECFGFQRFHSAYGFVNLCKLIVVCVLGVIAINPLSVYLYPIHPLDQDEAPRNGSEFDLQDFGDTSLPASLSSTRILLGLAVPPVLCTLAWLTEDIYKLATRRCSMPTMEKAEVRSMAIP